jgi:hypothetical protein
VETQELIYSRGQLSAEQVEQEIVRFWTELNTSSELQAELAADGIDTGALRDMESADAISVRVDSSGVDPVSVSLIIMFAPTYNKILKDV